MMLVHGYVKWPKGVIFLEVTWDFQPTTTSQPVVDEVDDCNETNGFAAPSRKCETSQGGGMSTKMYKGDYSSSFFLKYTSPTGYWQFLWDFHSIVVDSCAQGHKSRAPLRYVLTWPVGLLDHLTYIKKYIIVYIYLK